MVGKKVAKFLLFTCSVQYTWPFCQAWQQFYRVQPPSLSHKANKAKQPINSKVFLIGHRVIQVVKEWIWWIWVGNLDGASLNFKKICWSNWIHLSQFGWEWKATHETNNIIYRSSYHHQQFQAISSFVQTSKRHPGKHLRNNLSVSLGFVICHCKGE